MRRSLVLVGIVVGLIAGVVLMRFLAGGYLWLNENRFPAALERAGGDRFAALASMGEVRFFVPLARDPLLFQEHRDVDSYRASRPLLSWLAWIVNGGRSTAPAALFFVIWLSAIAAAVAVGVLARARGLSVWWGLVAIMLPGSLVGMGYGGCDLLAAALVFAGLACWRDRPVLGVTLFALAGLARETALLVPATLLIHGLITERRLHMHLMLAPIAWLAWASVLAARLRAWPWEAAPSGAWGFGISAAFSTGDAVIIGSNLIVMLLLPALIFLGLRRGRLDPLVWISCAFLLLSVPFGGPLWYSWWHFGRIMLVGHVAGMIAVASQRTGAMPATIMNRFGEL